MTPRPVRFALGLTALLLPLVTQAADKPEYAVAYRQGIMNGLAWNIGPLGKMVKGDMEFDAKRFAFLAERAAVLAPMALEAFTADTTAVKSHAKPEIYKNLDDFKKRMQDLQTGTAELAKVAKSGDEAKMRVTFGDTVKICKGCHDEYQEKH
ncbi:MAG: cytochrome c [Gammaproteobacteria bacterium]